MTIALEGSADSSSQSTCTLSISSGNLLVCAVNYYGSGDDITEINDDAGNTFVRAIKGISAGEALFTDIWYAENTIGQANNEVTVTWNQSTSYQYINLSEWSGIATSSSLDQTNQNNEAGVTSHQSGEVTTTQADEVLIHQLQSQANENWTEDTGWTYLNSDVTSVDDFTQYKISSSTGTYEGTATSGTTTDTVNAIATWKATAPPPVPSYTSINIGDSWKTVSGTGVIKVNIGDAWKSVTSSAINIGDAWKTAVIS